MVRLAVMVVALLAASASAASDLPRRIGMYPQQGAALAMLDSDVVVRVRGPIIEATVTQTFRNDTDRVTEATYIFPLPADAAVSAMEITTASRTIRAAIEPREQAVQRYEAAVTAGIGAGLLEQERPDVFTQTVSAIPARGTVKVTLRFDSVARYRAGTWELALPLVVAPRYVAGTASGRPSTGTGRSPDTDRAPDASRVTPGGAPGAGGPTSVLIEFGDTVEGVASPTHELSATKGGYAFTDPKSDHDVVVRWRAKAPTQAWVEAGDGGGYAAVLVEAKPAAVTRKAAVRVALVVDHAATMRGDADAVQRPLVHALLAGFSARDTVAIGGSGKLVWGSGGAAQRVLDERGPQTTPFDLATVLPTLRGDHAVVLVSDGLVADDKAVLAAAATLKTPVHVIGIGPAPNRGLLAQIAATTGGTVRFAAVGDDFAALARDVLADTATQPERIAITWGTLAVSDIVPATLPRLGSGQALLVLGRVKKLVAANARVRGDVIGFVDVASTKAPEGATSTRGTLGRRWAKERLDELVAAGNAKAITDHALRYGLVSPMTSMVAIGDEVVVQGGVKHTVAVPVSVPAGMQWQLVKEQTTVDTTVTKQPLDGRVADAKPEPVEKKPDVVAKKPKADKAENKAADKAKDRLAKEQHATEPRKKTGGKSNNTAREPVTTRQQSRPTVVARPPREPIAAGPRGGEGATVQPSAPESTTKAIDIDADSPRAEELDDSAAPSPPPTMATGSASGAYDEEEDSEDGEARTESISMSSRRRALRLSLALGAGVATTRDDTGAFGAATARVEFGRRTLVGVEGSLWLVDGLHAQGSVLGTATRRGIARRFELGAGLGARITGDAVGPALELTIRALLPLRGLATYLRYDGALLRSETTSIGQHAGSFGIEARW
jgi:Ca-activated chloride channel family protein